MIKNIHDFDMRKLGREEGLAEGKLEGAQNAKLSAARKLIEKGMDLETIAEVEDLPLETVQELASEKVN